MKKTFTEIFTAMKERVSSPFIRYFSIGWIIFNYKFWYILFFQDETLFLAQNKILKIDYLTSGYFSENVYLNFGGYILFFLLLPIVYALFFLFIFPKLNNNFLKKHQDNIDKEEDIKQDLRLKEIGREIKRKEARLVEKKTEKKIKQTEKDIGSISVDMAVNPYDKDYENFKNTQIFTYFDSLVSRINLGNEVIEYSMNGDTYYIPQDILNKYVGLGIIEKLDRTGYAKFTEKGKYFSQKFFTEIS